jgi:deoxyribonuclease-4
MSDEVTFGPGTGAESIAALIEDEVGAHVSAAGGVENAPGRARRIGSTVFQIFTKQPNRWAEGEVSAEQAGLFEQARQKSGTSVSVSHDSYLINLASPTRGLWGRSLHSFKCELQRCAALGLDLLVTHPGNATDGDLESGLARNADGVGRALEDVAGSTRLLLEITAGSGTSVGGSFESLAVIIDQIPSAVRTRVGICFDTCHAYSAGYDLVEDFEGVWAHFDDVLGMDRLGLFHLNDSQHPFGSHKDRHQHIGEGTLGDKPFRRIMSDDRFHHVPKVLETPKGDDSVVSDCRNLARLRLFRESE